jgi:hypothetical protein
LCKHVIAICEREKLLNFPEAAKQIPVGQNRKRGRPKQTYTSLEFQPNEEQECAYSDTEDELLKSSKKKITKKTITNEHSEDDFDIFDDDKVQAAMLVLPNKASINLTNHATTSKNKNAKRLRTRSASKSPQPTKKTRNAKSPKSKLTIARKTKK